MGGLGSAIRRATQVALAVPTGGASLTKGGENLIGQAGAVGQKLYDTGIKGETNDGQHVDPGDAPLPTDSTDTSAIDDAAAKERRARGRASTYYTGGRGLTTQATTASRTLLGS